MPPIALSIADAARAIGIGRTKLIELINVGTIQTVKIGRRTLVRTSSLEALISGGEGR